MGINFTAEKLAETDTQNLIAHKMAKTLLISKILFSAERYMSPLSYYNSRFVFYGQAVDFS